EQPRARTPARTPTEGLPRWASSAWMRCAAASVTAKACFCAISVSLPRVFILPAARDPSTSCGDGARFRHLFLLSQAGNSGSQRIDREIDLRGGGEPAEAEANRGIRPRFGHSERPQDIGGLDAGRGAGRAGRYRDARAGLDQRRGGEAGKGQIETG